MKSSSAAGSCNLGNCQDQYTPDSTGTWTVKLIKDSDSSVLISTTFTVNAGTTTTTQTTSTTTTTPYLGLNAGVTAGTDFHVIIPSMQHAGTYSQTITITLVDPA